MQQESATKGDFERWVADRRRQWEQNRRPCGRYSRLKGGEEGSPGCGLAMGRGVGGVRQEGKGLVLSVRVILSVCMLGGGAGGII